MVRLYDLIGSENLPKKKITTPGQGCKCFASGYSDCGCFNVNWTDYTTMNEAITQIEKCRLMVDEEKLAKELFEDLRRYLIRLSPKSENIITKDGKKLFPTWEEAIEDHKNGFRVKAKALSTTLNQWIEIRRID